MELTKKESRRGSGKELGREALLNTSRHRGGAAGGGATGGVRVGVCHECEDADVDVDAVPGSGKEPWEEGCVRSGRYVFCVPE